MHHIKSLGVSLTFAHLQAAILNQYFARHYEGKFLIRFDDTNPSKEKVSTYLANSTKDDVTDL